MCGERNPQCEFSTKPNPPQSWISVDRRCRSWPSSSGVNLAWGRSYSRICWCDPSAAEEKCKALTTECSALFDRKCVASMWDVCIFRTLQSVRIGPPWSLTTASGNHHCRTTNFLQPCLSPAGKPPAKGEQFWKIANVFSNKTGLKRQQNLTLFFYICDKEFGLFVKQILIFTFCVKIFVFFYICFLLSKALTEKVKLIIIDFGLNKIPFFHSL